MNASDKTYSLLKVNREKGLKVLFERYSKKLLNYSIYKWKTEPDVAWDIIYKTFYKAADVIGDYEFESEEKFASFIFKIYLNYLRNHIRDTKTATGDIKEVELKETIISSYTESSTTPSSAPALTILKKELDKLEDWQRILLLMRGQDIPYSEISRYVQKPENQLKVYYRRLKKQLAENIGEQLSIVNKKVNV